MVDPSAEASTALIQLFGAQSSSTRGDIESHMLKQGIFVLAVGRAPDGRAFLNSDDVDRVPTDRAWIPDDAVDLRVGRTPRESDLPQAAAMGRGKRR